MIIYAITDEVLARELARISAQFEDTEPLMGGIALELLSQTEANFAAEGRPAWMGLKVPRPGMILQKSGQLAASVTPYHSATEAGVGSNKVYAAIQQLGGTTKPHVIEPKNGKALKFGNVFARRVNHPGSVIPARPYLPILPDGTMQSEAEEGVLDVATVFLRKIVEGS